MDQSESFKFLSRRPFACNKSQSTKKMEVLKRQDFCLKTKAFLSRPRPLIKINTKFYNETLQSWLHAYDFAVCDWSSPESMSYSLVDECMVEQAWTQHDQRKKVLLCLITKLLTVTCLAIYEFWITLCIITHVICFRTACRPAAELASFWNKPIVSWVATDPDFNDKTVFTTLGQIGRAHVWTPVTR